MSWLKKLSKDNRGSRPRSVLLTEGSREQVAERLTQVVCCPQIKVSTTDQWQPRGKLDVREAQLDKHLKGGAVLLSEATRQQLKEWWLAADAPPQTRTPTWDIASTCTVLGKTGLLLVEAKAHVEEMSKIDKCNARGANRTRIKDALKKSNAGLQELTGGSWKLSSQNHYQLSNRFAWSWKLARLGVPVVLVYIGFLDAQDMKDDGELFQSKEDWKNTLLAYCRNVVDKNCWDKKHDVEGIPLVPLIRVVKQPFDPNRHE